MLKGVDSKIIMNAINIVRNKNKGIELHYFFSYGFLWFVGYMYPNKP